MRLSWNEIRLRAAAFAAKWADASYEKGETQPFYEEFFRIFGVERRSVARYEEQVRRLDRSSGTKRGYMDLFWPGVLLVEQKSAGRSLEAAAEQADAYFDALPERDRPRYRLLSDFRTFDLYDRDERERVSFPLPDLPAQVERFGFILGVERRTFRDQDPVNIEAAELMGRLHDRLRDTGYTGAPLEHYLVRLLFCLFADDTGVFEPRDLLLDLLESRTREDGSWGTGCRCSSRCSIPRPKTGTRRSTKTWRASRTSTATSSGGRCPSPLSTAPCAARSSTPAGSTGRRSPRRSSARSSSPSWTRSNAASRAPTTPPSRTS